MSTRLVPAGCSRHPVGTNASYLVGRVSLIALAMRGTSVEDFIGFVPDGITAAPGLIVVCRVRPSFSNGRVSPAGWYVIKSRPELPPASAGYKIFHFSSLDGALRSAGLDPLSISEADFAMFEVMVS